MIISTNILGYGAVGSEVVKKIQSENLSVQINAVLIKDRSKHPPIDAETGVHFTDDNVWLMSDEHISLVIDCLPGVEPSLTYIKKALDNGSDVITCNKELVQHHGAELCEYAKTSGRTIYFNSIPSSLVAAEINEKNITHETLLNYEDSELYSYRDADGEITARYILSDVVRVMKRANPGSTDLTVCEDCNNGNHG